MKAASDARGSLRHGVGVLPWLWRLSVAVIGLAAARFYAQYPLHYLTRHTPESFGGYWLNRGWLLLHIAGATVALAVGPFELWSGFHRRYLRTHRLLGVIYLGAALVGGVGAFRLAWVSAAVDKWVSVFVFAAAWWFTLAMAYVAIRQRRITQHRDWMIRGYVLTYGFVTIRALGELPVWAALGAVAEPTTNWLGWVVPLLLTDAFLQRRHRVTVHH